MKNKITFIAVIIAALTLAACSGFGAYGGGYHYTHVVHHIHTHVIHVVHHVYHHSYHFFRRH